MWMCAGFTMLEAGSVRTKNAAMICLKNIGLYSIAGLAYFVIGYNLMYGDLIGGFIGEFKLFYGSTANEVALVGGEAGQGGGGVGGAGLRDDVRLVLPDGVRSDHRLDNIGRDRRARSSCGASLSSRSFSPRSCIPSWAHGRGAAAGCPRWDSKTSQDPPSCTALEAGRRWPASSSPVRGWAGSAATARFRARPPSNVLVVTLGVFILWFGWFGFNGGSVLALGDAASAVNMANVLVNTNLAAGAGVITAIAISRPIFGRIDLFAGLNGALAGLVAITAGPDFTDHYWAIIIGAIGSVICTLGIKLLEVVKLDDVVGAIPAHLFAGIWGHARREHRGRRRPARAARGSTRHRRAGIRRVVRRVAGAALDAERRA